MRQSQLVIPVFLKTLPFCASSESAGRVVLLKRCPHRKAFQKFKDSSKAPSRRKAQAKKGLAYLPADCWPEKEIICFWSVGVLPFKCA